MLKIDNLIVAIDLATSLTFLVSFIISLRNYNKTVSKTNIWLIIGVTFAFMSMVSITNFLEWSGITSALDPAEDFIIILVIAIWSYIFLNLNKL